MARLPSSFNAKDSDKLGDFRALPAGTYLAQIIKSEMKDTKNRDGKYLSLQFQIMEGDYVNRYLFSNLNLINANPQTVEIAEKALATISECCGIDMLEDSEELHNKPMYINVTVRPKTAQYPESNDIKGYLPYDGDGPQEVAAKPSAASKNPPWKK